ncbi:MAG: 2-hydroxychromene-2-carboxylate isomerase [Cellvibrionaceae bacterium]|jgi:2-hydroxychromene-2-carboxylate isomerase
MTKEIPFYFDYISHNAYLAWTQLPRLAQEHNVTFQPVPILFGAVLKHNNTLGPAEVPPKIHWMTKDVMRKSKLLNVPLNPPATHPFNPLLSLRATCAVADPAEQSKLIDAMWKAVWVDSQDVTSTDVVAEVASSVGLDGRHLIEQTQNPDVKKILINNTQQAIERGVFGVPSMIVGEELFWGFDDFPHFELALQGEDPFDPAEFAAWENVKPSVHRKP